METSNQLKAESDFRNNKHVQDNVIEKTNNILDDLEKEKKDFPAIIPKDIRNFYEEQITRLVKKYFFSEIQELPNNFEMLHDFQDAETNELNHLINNLKHSFKDVYRKIDNEYSKTKANLNTIKRKIAAAEKDSEDERVSNLRNEKDLLDKRIVTIDSEIRLLEFKIHDLKNDSKTLKQKQTDLRNKIDESRSFSEKDKKAQEIISYLKNFIKSFKEEKKKSLEERMLKELNLLLHKKNFINKIIVDINQAGDDVNINLLNSRGEKIDKGSLSMGERQMYASALLKSLVDESDIDFPVFIDSPLQKFDKDHAENVIKEFYPNVSKQVVLFPLFHKELSEKEYALLKPKVSKTFLIHNKTIDASEFKETKPEEFINTYNELYAN